MFHPSLTLRLKRNYPSAEFTMIVRFETKPATFAELHERLGSVPLERIMMAPAPTTATRQDLITGCEYPYRGCCELIEGTFVLRCSTLLQSVMVGVLGARLSNFVEQTDAGVVLNSLCPFEFVAGSIRRISLCFIPWNRLPNDELPDRDICEFVPEFTVDFFNESNTAAELGRRLQEYFDAGIKLAWVIDPRAKTARIHTSATKFKLLDETGVLDGGKVLTGFQLPLAELFAAGKKPKKKSR